LYLFVRTSRTNGCESRPPLRIDFCIETYRDPVATRFDAFARSPGYNLDTSPRFHMHTGQRIAGRLLEQEIKSVRHHHALSLL
jgi:hypothetical protein